MTTAPESQAITLGGFLFGDSGIASALQASGTADAVHGKLASFTQGTRNEAVRELGRISDELLSLKLTDVLLAALSTYQELRAAGWRTIAAPDSEELVELVSHQVTLENQPSIDLLIDDVHAATVHMVLSVVIDIQALTATVRQGRLTALRAGRCTVDASVGIEGTTVARKQAQLQLPISLSLGEGLPLAAPAPEDTAPPLHRP